MFTEATIGILILTAVVVVGHLALSITRRGKGRAYPLPRCGWLAYLAYIAMVGGVAVLAGTSIYPVIAHGHMLNWWLWTHLMGAGVFVVAMAAVAVLWSEVSFFRRDVVGGSPLPRFNKLTRVSFWVLMVSGVISLATMMISMLPVAGTEAMDMLISLHRYAGLVLTGATVVHLYALSAERIGL